MNHGSAQRRPSCTAGSIAEAKWAARSVAGTRAVRSRIQPARANSGTQITSSIITSKGGLPPSRGPALGLEPLVEDRHVPAHAEVAHSQIEVGLRLVRMRDLRARGDAETQRGGDHVALRLDHSRMIPLPGETDAHRVVGGTE